MKAGSNRRLANVKTRTETGLEFVLRGLSIQTPHGQKVLKELKPFFPGEESLLREELDRTEQMGAFAETRPELVDALMLTFMCMKDIGGTLERCRKQALSEIELFEVKTFLLNMTAIRATCQKAEGAMDDSFVPPDVTEALSILDPNGERMNTFYLYDDFSETLGALRREKKELERSLRKIQKEKRAQIRKEYGLELTPKFDVVIPKSSPMLETAKAIPWLELDGEDYMSMTFRLRGDEQFDQMTDKMETLTGQIEAEEEVVCGQLSGKLASHIDQMEECARRVGELDYTLAKAAYAKRHQMVKPTITEAHQVSFREGRMLQVESILQGKGKTFCPISLDLVDGVTCITGANMGGKTISLKLAGLIPIMAQYGFFVPCQEATIGLSNFMQLLIGDSQSVERGLSSFGSEMEELKEILDHAQDRSVILIDEIASGTNPVEGLALTRSLIDHMKKKPYITLITTHFEAAAEDGEVRNMQVRGLAEADFDKLNSELRYANRRQRIDIIGKYMDYRLWSVETNRKIPRDALNIAKMLGLDPVIIEGAKKYIE